MKLIYCILISCVYNLSLSAMDLPAPVNTHISEKLAQDGYIYFRAYEDNPLGQQKVEELAEVMDKLAILSRSQDAHQGSYEAVFEYEKIKDECRLKNHNLFANPGEANLNILNLRVQEILSFLPTELRDQDLAASLLYFDDLKASIEKKFDYHDMQNKRSFEIFNLQELPWHQDKFANANYDFLFFTVLNTRGFSAHYCELGLVEEEHIGFRLKEGSRRAAQEYVETIVQLVCQGGAGYILDQRKKIGTKVLVHRRSAAQTYISNRTERVLENLSTDPKEHNVRCKGPGGYKAPRRGVFLIRISILAK